MPYVENGGGAVKGMSIEEQLWLSQFVEHPDKVAMSGMLTKTCEMQLFMKLILQRWK